MMNSKFKRAHEAWLKWRYPLKSLGAGDKYKCHVVLRNTYVSTGLGDTLEGRTVIQGFMHDGVYILVTKDKPPKRGKA